MSGKRVFVFTATGDQGRSVCKYLIEGGYTVRGLTRNPDGGAAKALKSLGVEVVKGDLDDVSSYEGHLEGMDGAYVNNDFFATWYTNGQNTPEAIKTEFRQSKDAIEACVRNGVGHVVFSALDHFDGKMMVPYCQAKADVAAWSKDKGYPVSYLYTCTYYSDFLKYGQITRATPGENGWVLGLPIPDETPIPAFAVEQTGQWVLAALEDPSKYSGKDIQVCAGRITALEMAEVLSAVTGQKITKQPITKEQFYSDGFMDMIGEPLWKGYQVYVEGLFQRDVQASKAVNPAQWDFAQWARQSEELGKLMQRD